MVLESMRELIRKMADNIGYRLPILHMNQGLIDPKKAMSIPIYSNAIDSFSFSIRYRSDNLNVQLILLFYS